MNSNAKDTVVVGRFPINDSKHLLDALREVGLHPQIEIHDDTATLISEQGADGTLVNATVYVPAKEEEHAALIRDKVLKLRGVT